jgi:hypothetical protein
MCLAPVVPPQKACNLGISNLWPEAAKNANAQEVTQVSQFLTKNEKVKEFWL